MIPGPDDVAAFNARLEDPAVRRRYSVALALGWGTLATLFAVGVTGLASSNHGQEKTPEPPAPAIEPGVK